MELHDTHTRYEKNRINLLRLLFKLLVSMVFMSRPVLDDTALSEVFEMLGNF